MIVIDLVDDDEDEEEEDKMTEFVEQDIEHLKFKLFSVSRSLAVRIFSLNIQFYKWQEMVKVFFRNQSQGSLNNKYNRFRFKRIYSHINKYIVFFKD